ncbi:hypothetical protein [Clostridium sp.]|uniref:hypothetical protein n=1 Tax=Clostridium sp. TaxID=1506 RepID=UPI002609B51C|nr:hypothetical protein [Clostridium sp.]
MQVIILGILLFLSVVLNSFLYYKKEYYIKMVMELQKSLVDKEFECEIYKKKIKK